MCLPGVTGWRAPQLIEDPRPDWNEIGLRDVHARHFSDLPVMKFVRKAYSEQVSPLKENHLFTNV